MPSFRWKGRGAGGDVVQGELQAASKEQVLVRLREFRIAVTQIEETGGGEPEDPDRAFRAAPRPADKRPRPLRGLLIALAFAAGAAAVGAMAPITTYQCSRGASGSADCTIRERILGVYPLHEQTLAGVTTVDTEAKPVTFTSGTRRRTVSQERIVLGNAAGQTIRPKGWAQSDTTIGTPTADVERSLETLLADTAPGEVRAWQGQWVPLLFASLLLLIAALMTGLSLLGMFLLSRR